jgi:DNA-binding MarR family transcriptional regulator
MHVSNVLVAWVNTVHDQLGEGMREAGLEPRDLAALTLVAQHDGCSLDWLRERVDLTQSGTVRLVDRLSGRDLLARGAPSGRSVPLHVTAAGQEVLHRWAAIRDRITGRLLADLPDEQRALLVSAMAGALQGRPRVRAQADAACRVCTWPACGTDCPVDRSVTGTRPGRSP